MDFALAGGQFYTVIGPNGAGKSTLLRLMTGDVRQYHGTLELFGRPVHRYSPSEFARVCAVIDQGAIIRFPFTCLEIVLMGRHPFRPRLSEVSPVDLEIVETAMRLTATRDFADRLITEISGGELQRVLLARALAQQPLLVLHNGELQICAPPRVAMTADRLYAVFSVHVRHVEDKGLLVLPDMATETVGMAGEQIRR